MATNTQMIKRLGDKELRFLNRASLGTFHPKEYLSDERSEDFIAYSHQDELFNLVFFLRQTNHTKHFLKHLLYKTELQPYLKTRLEVLEKQKRDQSKT